MDTPLPPFAAPLRAGAVSQNLSLLLTGLSGHAGGGAGYAELLEE